MNDMGAPVHDLDSFDGGDAGDDDDGCLSPAALPEGVRKEIVREAESSQWRSPKKGDEVTVHYVGTLASDGSRFDSSRERGEPLVFGLGQGQVIKGWDQGVATMKKGEIARFTLAPEFAYGKAGSPPKIPASATLVFEVELLSWVSREDLFGDGGVVKTQVTEGSGWRVPKAGDEVRLSLRALRPDGGVVEERADVDYALGAPDLGPLGRACDRALGGMKKGETASLRCARDYMYGDGDGRAPEGGSVELTLHEIFETKDVSPLKDGSVTRKRVREGEGHDTCKDACRARLRVEAMTDGAAALAGFAPGTLEFTVGSGEVADVFEFAVADMKKGERAVVTCARPSLCAEPRLGVGEAPKAEKVVLTLELEDFEKGRDTWSMEEGEKLAYGAARKQVGGALFKQGRTELALECYKRVAELFGCAEGFKEENRRRAEELRRLSRLNQAACQLRLRQHREARETCEAVLRSEGSNLKALFRRAQASLGLADFDECLRDARRVLALEPQNREARLLLKQARAGQRAEDDNSKGLFARMCRGLSSPVPASAKAAPDSPADAAAADEAAAESVRVA